MSSTDTCSLPPFVRRGPWVWARRNLFSSVGSTVVTIICVAIIAAIGAALLDFLVLSAAWRGTKLSDCAEAEGACYPFIRARFDQFIYGIYPQAERWRIEIALTLAAALSALVAVPALRRRPVAVLALVLVWPVATGIMLRGGVAGLAAVEPAKWGGLILTLFLAATAITISLPMGVALALGRRSRKPVIRTLSVCWIEFWRGVPMLAVLFVAVSMFPLFMPAELELDRLMRAMAAFVIVTGAFMAEAVRGGLQSVPPGQYQAAKSLGLGYWRTTWLIALPQALPVAMPSIVSIAILVFKETTLVIVVGVFCLLGMIQVAATSPEWISEQAILTGYALAAAVYWIFCFALSRVGLGLEARLARSHRN
jgi:general L-amino acid transport system permease protein